MPRLVVIGAGGHGQVVADAVRQRPGWDVVGYLDEDPSLRGAVIGGVRVLGGIEDLPDVDHEEVVVAIGENRRRAAVVASLRELGEHFGTILHPRAVVAEGIELGQGAMVLAGCVVNVAARIGEHVILNTGCTVDHHCEVGDYAHIGPGAHLGGGVSIGEGALVGIGASLLPSAKVGAWAIVGAGGVVLDEVVSGSVVAGVPVRDASRERRS